MLRPLNYCLLTLAALFGAIGTAEETGKPVSTADAEKVALAKKLIQELAAESYPERQKARNELFQLGRPAIEPLEAAAQSEESEIRLRAIELLIAMRGRGFMGIGLSEDWGDHAPNAEGAEDARPSTPLVRVTQILDHRTVRMANGSMGLPAPLPAETAGLQIGDAIVALNGRPIHGVKDLMREVIIIGPARVVLADIDRDGKLLRIPILLTRNPTTPTGEMEPPPPVDLEKEIDAKPDANQRASLAPRAGTYNYIEDPAVERIRK